MAMSCRPVDDGRRETTTRGWARNEVPVMVSMTGRAVIAPRRARGVLRRSAWPALCLLLAIPWPGTAAEPAKATSVSAAATDAPPSLDAGPVLDADARRLVPAGDVAVDGVTRGEGDAADPSPLFMTLADGPGATDADDATTLLAPAGRSSSYRMSLTGAPSGVVERVIVGYRVEAVDGPTTVRMAVFDGDDLAAVGPDHPLAMGAGWQDLVDVIDPVLVRRAADLRVELRFDSAPVTGGSTRTSQLWVQAELRVSLDFDTTRLTGGGPYTAIARAPDRDTLLVGSAQGGLFRAARPGARFRARNAAFVEPDWMRIASIVYHPTRPGTVYAAAGDHGDSGSIHRSTDDGRTWQLVTGQLSFSAAVEPQRPGLTVAAGTLLAIADDAAGTTTIWAATIAHGLMRSLDAGVTWRTLGLNGLLLRGIAGPPSDPDTLYLATSGAGTWMVTGAWSATPRFRRLAGGPLEPDELAWVGETLVIAGGREGLFRLDGDVLVAMNEGVPLGTSSWTTIGGYAAPGGDVLFAACTDCDTTQDGTRAGVVRSVDGGATWWSVTTPGSVDTTVFGQDRLWLLLPALADAVPGGPAFRPLHLVVRSSADGNPDRASVSIAAVRAVWQSDDGGARWQPAVAGLGGLGARGAEAGAAEPGWLMTSSPDLGSVVTTDWFRSIERLPWTGEGIVPLEHPVASGVAVDPAVTSGTVAVAVMSTARPAAGEVLIGRVVAEPGVWAPTGFNAAFPGMRPTSVAMGRDGTGAEVLVATVHPGGGIVRKVGEGPWLRVEAGPASADPKGIARADLAWIAGTGVLYLFDPPTGIHRSTDAGVTWQHIWEVRSNRAATARIATTADASVLYASTNQGLYRLDGADRGTVEGGEIGLTQLGTFRKPGAITVDRHGRLWVVSEPLPGSPARLAVSWDPGAEEPTFHDLASEAFVNAVVTPDAITVADDGRVLLADAELGVVVGTPAARIRELWLSPDVVVHAQASEEGPMAPIEPVDPAVAPPLDGPFTVWVAADGDDAASGLAEATPVRTLERAQARLIERFGVDAERLDRDAVIRVASGRYEDQHVRWTFTHPGHVVRIEGYAPSLRTTKPRFVGCVRTGCASTRAWFELAGGDGRPTNVQIVNIQVTMYHRAVIFRGGSDPASGWNGWNVIHRSDFQNIGTRFRTEITPEVWSPGIIILDNSRFNRIWGNRVTGSANRLDHANPWFHTVYASHGSTDNSIRNNLIVDTSGDFHVRDGSDRNVFAGNVMVGSFYWAIVTEWSGAGETDVCETGIDANVVIGDWYCRDELKLWNRETASPDGRCGSSGVPDFETGSPNVVVPPLSSCTPP